MLYNDTHVWTAGNSKKPNVHKNFQILYFKLELEMLHTTIRKLYASLVGRTSGFQTEGGEFEH